MYDLEWCPVNHEMGQDCFEQNVVKMIVIGGCELGCKLEADCEDCRGDRLKWLWKMAAIGVCELDCEDGHELACKGIGM